MPDPTRNGQQRVVLYVRDDLPEPTRRRLETLSARLDDLVAEGVIESYSTTTWEKRQRMSETEAQWSRYVSFREWARTADVTLSPGFETRRCYSMETGECAEWLVFPVVCMAVYENQQLTGVYPHEGEQSRSVRDGISSLTDPVAERALPTAVGSSASD